MIKNPKFSNFKGFFKKNSKLYKNGYLENNILPKNKVEFEKWKEKNLFVLSEFANDWEMSNYRINWLDSTISYLSQYGTVFLVRTPMQKEFLEIENAFWADFDSKVRSVARNNKIRYLNYSKQSEFGFYDGHHLDKYGAKLFSMTLAKDIIKMSQTK